MLKEYSLLVHSVGLSVKRDWGEMYFLLSDGRQKQKCDGLLPWIFDFFLSQSFCCTY